MERVRNHRVVVTGHGAPDVLQLVDEDLPQPAAGEVRVKVLAAGVSAFDLMYRRWAHLPGSPSLPFTLGEDVVGVADQLGEGVSSLEPGQVVAGGTWVLGVGGGYTEHVCLPQGELVPVPAGVDPAEAVCLVVNYLTAHQHLHQIGRVRGGEQVLVHGAAGGVGSAVVQLGALAGLDMYGTAGPAQQELVASLGATPIDYRTEDFVERIRTFTVGGVDIVVDPVGGPWHLWRSYRALANGGRLVWLGSSAVEEKGLGVGPLSMLMMLLLRLIPDGKKAPRCPIMAKWAQANPRWYRDTLTDLLALLAEGRITPIVAERIPLAEAARAHELLEGHGHVGKLVLVTDAYQDHRRASAGEVDAGPSG
jgi:NADPH:quinone reductase-like Zn-dependent oxidoreductase